MKDGVKKLARQFDQGKVRNATWVPTGQDTSGDEGLRVHNLERQDGFYHYQDFRAKGFNPANNMQTAFQLQQAQDREERRMAEQARLVAQRAQEEEDFELARAIEFSLNGTFGH
jgi:regulator of protease activity HflC (stomatin/prohibitin superfamily)